MESIKPCKNEDCKWYEKTLADPGNAWKFLASGSMVFIYQRCLACSYFDRTQSYYEKKCGEIKP